MLMWKGNEILKSSAATSAANKTFVIDHPQDEEKYLVHVCLEGPEAGVYYRGEDYIDKEKNYTEITLPKYVDALATNFSIHLTAIDEIGNEPRNLSTTKIKNGKFCVIGKPGLFYWIIYGQRGKIDVEPNKKDVKLCGNGPYKWIE